MYNAASRDRTIKVWHYEESSECWSTLRKKLRPSAVNVIKLVDGEKMFSGYKDGSITLWDLNTSKNLSTIRQHKGCVENLVTLRDGMGESTNVVFCSHLLKLFK